MVSKFWARVLISLAVLLCSVAGWGSPYGRFGFTDWPSVPGFDFQPDGIRVLDPPGDKIGFVLPIKNLKPKRVGWQDALFQGQDQAYSPGAVRVGGFRPGFSLYFPIGLRFHFSTSLSPFLTWNEGTVDMDNPTAPSKWILLSFRDGQAPILLIFEDPVQLVIKGNSGDWTLSTTEKFKGWVRLLAPFGNDKLGSTASALGEAVNKLKPVLKYLEGREPELVSSDVKEDADGLTAIWNFDGPGAAIPMAALMAKAGGYQARILTGVSAARLELPDGPVQWSTEPRIVVKFPALHVPVGRALAVGDPPTDFPGTASAYDLPSVVDLGLANLSSARDNELYDAVTKVREEYEKSMKLVQEPTCGNWSPVGKEGRGLDLVAGQAFLRETLINDQVNQSSENLAFQAVNDRMDWQSWTVWTPFPEVKMRCTALLAVAGSLSQSIDRRLAGAMAEAGLAAQGALRLYQKRRGFQLTGLDAPDVLDGWRRSVYVSSGKTSLMDPFVQSLTSQVRVVSRVKVTAVRQSGGYLVSWDPGQAGSKNLVLMTGYPVEVEAKTNLVKVTPSSVFGMTSLTFEPEKEGTCSILLKLPKWADPLPAITPLMRYSEKSAL